MPIPLEGLGRNHRYSKLNKLALIFDQNSKKFHSPVEFLVVSRVVEFRGRGLRKKFHHTDSLARVVDLEHAHNLYKFPKN